MITRKTNIRLSKVKELESIIKSLGFKDSNQFKKYMKSIAKLNEFGDVCATEIRDGLELNYSNNCLHKFGIGGNFKGIFCQERFN